MMLPRWVHSLLVFAAFLLHFSFAVFIDRFNTPAVIMSFALVWLVFIIQWADREISVKRMITLGMVFRGIYLLTFPDLSDDVFRYLWDGMLTNQGISPYAIMPSQWADVGLSESFGQMLHQLNSPEYYSVYPPVLQGIFAASVWLGNGEILSSIIALRVFVLLAEFGTMLLIWRLLQAWRLDTRNLMLYALNPLVIIEFAGSLHGEVFMVFFLLLSLWFLEASRKTVIAKEDRLTQSREDSELTSGGLPRNPKSGFLAMTWLSAVAFGLSVGTKLLPLMFLPFYIKRLGGWKTAVYGAVAILVTGLLFIPFWTPDLLTNISTSLKLYFANFEFNASIYYLIREVGFWYRGYNIIEQTAVWLPRVVLLVILLIAFLNKDKEIRGLPKLMLFAWFTYYAFATTVHPWYVAVLAVFLPFVKYRFALAWLMLVPLSYHAYGGADFHENGWLLLVEYVPVYLWLGFELGLFCPLARWWALRKAEVKRKRLLPLLVEVDPSLRSGKQEPLKLLEVGAGNGALMKLLGDEGMKLSALDIEDKSLFDDSDVRVYDGEKFPFGDKEFNVCQLITMLHHTTNAEELIREAKRVSDRVIIMEDIYENPLQKYITWFTDSLVNWEFYGHPHTNRTDAEWNELFERNGLVVDNVEYYRFLVLFKQVTYVLRS
jgi:SAM-dependent methyltransferase